MTSGAQNACEKVSWTTINDLTNINHPKHAAKTFPALEEKSMVAEVLAGFQAFKSMLDIIKSMKDMNDAVKRNSAIYDLGEQVISAQTRYVEAVEEIRALEKKLAEFEAWDREKQRYDLKNVGWGAFAYMLKPAERGKVPPHWVCTNCFDDRRVAVTIQLIFVKGRGQVWTCPSCKSTIDPGISTVSWSE